MLVLKANATQYKDLNGYQKGVSKLEFIKDGSDKWIVGIEVLNDPYFEEIKDQLSGLTKIEYTPKIETI